MISHVPTPSDLAWTEKLFNAACSVRLQGYAPYSKYLVGAAILTVRDRIYAGCNVEGADYDGTHAEESALSAMVADGDRSPVMLAVFGGLEGANDPVTVSPCGKCRQKLMEFSSLSGRNLRILTRNESLELRVVLLSDLLPGSFGPGDIGVELEKYRR